jgi:hypothetical protein
MLMKMVFLEMTISEVPMVLDTALRAGNSKMKIIRTVRSYLTLFVDRRRWESRARTFLKLPQGQSATMITYK